MITLRPSESRGRNKLGWLDARHTFSFGDYYDPQHMSFSHLRVINQDIVAPAQGFGRHPHRDMEILTYIISGALEHGDSMGNSSVLQPGEIQRMSAGTGVFHSEFNHSKTEPVHLLQIWITPEKTGSAPSYEQERIEYIVGDPKMKLIAGPNPTGGAVTIHQRAEVFSSVMQTDEEAVLELGPKGEAWVQLVKGRLQVGDAVLEAGDGAGIERETALKLRALEPTETLVFRFNV